MWDEPPARQVDVGGSGAARGELLWLGGQGRRGVGGGHVFAWRQTGRAGQRSPCTASEVRNTSSARIAGFQLLGFPSTVVSPVAFAITTIGDLSSRLRRLPAKLSLFLAPEFFQAVKEPSDDRPDGSFVGGPEQDARVVHFEAGEDGEDQPGVGFRARRRKGGESFLEVGRQALQAGG